MNRQLLMMYISKLWRNAKEADERGDEEGAKRIRDHQACMIDKLNEAMGENTNENL